MFFFSGDALEDSPVSAVLRNAQHDDGGVVNVGGVTWRQKNELKHRQIFLSE